MAWKPGTDPTAAILQLRWPSAVGWSNKPVSSRSEQRSQTQPSYDKVMIKVDWLYMRAEAQREHDCWGPQSLLHPCGSSSGNFPGYPPLWGEVAAMATIDVKVTGFVLNNDSSHTGIKQRAPAWKRELPGEESLWLWKDSIETETTTGFKIAPWCTEPQDCFLLQQEATINLILGENALTLRAPTPLHLFCWSSRTDA